MQPRVPCRLFLWQPKHENNLCASQWNGIQSKEKSNHVISTRWIIPSEVCQRKTNTMTYYLTYLLNHKKAKQTEKNSKIQRTNWWLSQKKVYNELKN